jgi:hypothetical protein
MLSFALGAGVMWVLCSIGLAVLLASGGSIPEAA